VTNRREVTQGQPVVPGGPHSSARSGRPGGRSPGGQRLVEALLEVGEVFPQSLAAVDLLEPVGQPLESFLGLRGTRRIVV